MKNIMLLLILCIFTMCKTPKVEYKEYELSLPESVVERALISLNATEDKYSVLIFTQGFTGETMEITNGNEMVFHNVLKSIQNLGYAKKFRIDNTQLTTITELPQQYSFTVKSKMAMNYKYIYIHRNISNGRYTITYSNTLKGFR